MSVQDRVEALFEVVMYLPTFIVEGSTRIGRGARERPGRPGSGGKMAGCRTGFDLGTSAITVTVIITDVHHNPAATSNG